MIRTALFLIVLLYPGAGAHAAASDDVIIEVGRQVTAVRAADLDGDGLKDLVVLIESLPATPEERGIVLYLQKPGCTFCKKEIPHEWYRGAFFVDIGEYDRAPGKEIIIIGMEEVLLAGVRDGKPRLLSSSLSAPFLVKASIQTRFVFLDASFDLDGDGLDDPIVPAEGGYVVFLNGLRRKLPISIPVKRRISRLENTFFSMTTESGKIKVLKGTGGPPLVVMENRGRIVGFRWNPDRDGFGRMESPGSGFGSYPGDRQAGTIKYSGTIFGDFTGTGKPGLLMSQRSGRIGFITNLKTEHTIHDMVENAAKGELILKPHQVIANAGICSRPVLSDLNSDGKADLVLCFVEASVITKFLEALLDRVVITCQAFLFRPDKGMFSYEPDWNREIPVPSKCFETVGIEGLVMIDTDFTGDGRPDLLIYEEDRLLFYRGKEESRFLGLFSSDGIDYHSRPFYQAAGPFPGPLEIKDMDGDGRYEIVTSGDTIVRVIHVES